MNQRAIDIALLLPPPILEKAIELNQHVDGQEIDFTRPDMNPHVTLVMGCLDDRDLETARELLEEVAREFGPLPLRITGIKGKGASVSYELEKSETLQQLHQQLLSRLVPLLSFEVSKEMFYKPEEVRDNAVNYVQKFREAASYDLFWPHITLGHNSDTTPDPEKETNQEEDLPYTATRLALCHLGRHCTCRDILAETSLG